MKNGVMVLLIFICTLCSCIGPVQKHLESEREDCLQKNPGKEELCMSFFQKATLLYTQEPKYDEKKMTMDKYNELFKKSLVTLRKEMGLK